MAVGDLISATYTADPAAYTTFQPASGVQICITQFLASGETSENRIAGLGNINTSTKNLYTTNENSSGGIYYLSKFAGHNQKFFIDNASYLKYYTSAGHYSGFSGIQTK